jgi:hypothetical protein
VREHGIRNSSKAGGLGREAVEKLGNNNVEVLGEFE